MATTPSNPTSDPIRFFCRGRFLRLDKPEPFETGGTPRYEGTFIIDPTEAGYIGKIPKGAEATKLLLTTAAKLARETYGVVPLKIKKLAAKFIPGTPAVDLNRPENQDDGIKVFGFADGDDPKYANYSGYAGKLIVAANNSRLVPAVANKAGKKVIPGEPQYPYDGANIVGDVSIWIWGGETLKSYGKGVGINLRGVQFHSDNTSFGSGKIDEEEEFEALEDDVSVAVSTRLSDFD